MPNTPPRTPPAPDTPSTPTDTPTGMPTGALPRNEYTVDELARVTDTTVRNVRAYQDRGLLAPPEKRGRVGVYDDTHVSRLKLINHLLARGYTLANIQDLIKAVDEGHDLRSILGLETAIGGRWSREHPRKYSLIELLQMFGDKASPAALTKAVELGLLERDGLSFVSGSPTALAAGATLAKEGIPLADLLEAVGTARPHFNAVAKALVDLVVRQLDRYDADALPPPADVPALVDAIWRVRPLAMVLVESEMNRALEEASGDYLGDRVAAIMAKKLGESAANPSTPRAAGRKKPSKQ
ncbi:MerR family transcriptional regulator [Paraburkholderia phenoliruptrix]|uniref:MerR family transcriptional regulator n=1 Tax=Paraburkholderia phenoliruptrix TaxID=252970 RepID=UPI001C6EF42A|nr:MerR family transcriptional regulator [Paraburkholderia phenoliruptrix]MBW9104765.1 MerR family transcriptional regulator [Paraburkholderia phenoliruptrix]MBW9130467.1 MerR family transcriptional regulator [Paraburkholderia ginsengiterrae]